MLKQSYFSTQQWLMHQLLPASGTLQPSIKKSGAAWWQLILSCCHSQFYENYELSSEFWGKNISLFTSTTAYDWHCLWQWLLRFILLDLIICSVCDEIEFVYLWAEDNQTVHDLQAHLKQSQSYDVFKILSIFPLASNLWKLLVHHSYISWLKERVKFIDYIVEEGCHSVKPSHCHLKSHNPLMWRLLTMKRLVARAVTVDLLLKTQHGNKAEAVSA